MRTAECVTPSHPDKMCDRISDGILDWAIEQDPNARVAVEVMGGHGQVFVVGEVTMLNGEGLHSAVGDIIAKITGVPAMGGAINIVQQSPEIAGGVDTGGAGDQGIMRGYAVRDTDNLMPLEYELARSLCKYLYEIYPYDGKTQITLDDNGNPVAIVASFQNVNSSDLKRSIDAWRIVMNLLPAVRVEATIHANPAGDWSMGGFDADTGLTGRKLAVDNYGPRFPAGGGAFSGKDATKVDRSGAYMARRIAVDMLRKHNADSTEVELAYAIGVAQPVAATLIIQEGINVREVDLLTTKEYDLTPAGMIAALDLRKPIFAETAKWGHFGNGFGWDV